jgi:hypothetical protein
MTRLLAIVTVALAIGAVSMELLSIRSDVRDLETISGIQTCLLSGLSIEAAWNRGDRVPTDTLKTMLDTCGFIPTRRGVTL